MMMSEPEEVKKAKTEADEPSMLSTSGSTNADLPAHFAPHLCKSIARWNLLPPYHHVQDDQAWKAYYQERSLLEFRREEFFDIEECEEWPTLPRCYGYNQDCKAAAKTVNDKGIQVCGNCGKVASGRIVDVPDNVVKEWNHKVLFDPSLPKELPPMGPHCRESYAADCHWMHNTLAQYSDILEIIQKCVEDTLVKTNIFDGKSAKNAAKGVYMLEYWLNFEEPGVDAKVRTVEILTRFYSPIGTGASIDLKWYRHFRTRFYTADECFSELTGEIRELTDCNPKAPTFSHDDGRCLAKADGDSIPGRVAVDFIHLGGLKQLGETLFGEEMNKKISARKTFAVLARASGALHIGAEGGWVYSGMRKQYELYPGESSDQED